MANDDPRKAYLEYLDKEMTIMGVLTAFAVAVAAVVLDKVVGADAAGKSFLATMRATATFHVFVGSGAMMLAALCFYRQRSRLAWCYGQLALTLAEDSSPNQNAATKINVTGSTAAAILRDADSWDTWSQYRWAFGFLSIGFAGYVLALAGTQWNVLIGPRGQACYLAAAGVLLILIAASTVVLWRYRYENEPYRALLRWKPPAE